MNNSCSSLVDLDSSQANLAQSLGSQSASKFVVDSKKAVHAISALVNGNNGLHHNSGSTGGNGIKLTGPNARCKYHNLSEV